MAQRRARSSSPLLRNAMAQVGGWERLQRFSAVAKHSSLALAAKALGTTPCTLSLQVSRLERETGGALIERATRTRAMTVTEHGLAVLHAIAEFESKAVD